MSQIPHAPSREKTVSELATLVGRRALSYDTTFFQWGDAVAADALVELAHRTGDVSWVAPLHSAFRRWAGRPRTFADHLVPGSALLSVGDIVQDDDLINSARQLAAWLVQEVPRSPNRPYLRLFRPDLPQNRHYIWVDTLYHTPSFLAAAGMRFDMPELISEAVEIVESHLQALTQPGSPILAHAYDSGRELRFGHGWARGNGWAYLGLCDLLSTLPREHSAFGPLHQAFADLTHELIGLQSAAGLWPTLLDDPSAYSETSAAAFFATAMLKSRRVGLLAGNEASATCNATAKAFAAVILDIDDEGNCGNVSMWTHPSLSAEVNRDEYRKLPREHNMWGQGASLRLLLEESLNR